MSDLPKMVKQDDGSYLVGDKELHYDNLAEVIQCEVFGFCGCGIDLCDYLRPLLEHVEVRFAEGTDSKEWMTKLQSMLGLNDAYHSTYWFFWYVLDEKGITEHGGSAQNAWLTYKGKEVLKLMQEAKGE